MCISSFKSYYELKIHVHCSNKHQLDLSFTYFVYLHVCRCKDVNKHLSTFELTNNSTVNCFSSYTKSI